MSPPMYQLQSHTNRISFIGSCHLPKIVRQKGDSLRATNKKLLLFFTFLKKSGKIEKNTGEKNGEFGLREKVGT